MSVTLDSRQLRAFVAVADLGSFTLAGRHLNLTQSAISHAMQALEEDVGCRLLDRVGKSVMITQAGEQFLVRARTILDEMAGARLELGQLSQWGTGRLRLSASSTACEYILPAVLREFKESFPRCHISIDPGDSPAAIELLRQNRVDIALTLEASHEPRLKFRPLFTDELTFITSPLHPWAQKGRATHDEIGAQNYILYNKTSSTFKLIGDFFDKEEIALKSFIELGSMVAIKELVKLGLGVGILAPWIARKEIEQGALVSIPLPGKKLKRRWGILHWQGRRLSLPEETFIGLCQSVTTDLKI
ncbi:MAG: LysR family transcriptional regulator [Verrucomicrobia bacterium Tous-C9LFEB]|nr:MAG: LysR family transcriptional regulator [Verrucomicrobia bacterium Tous-C9LFEB]